MIFFFFLYETNPDNWSRLELAVLIKNLPKVNTVFIIIDVFKGIQRTEIFNFATVRTPELRNGRYQVVTETHDAHK